MNNLKKGDFIQNNIFVEGELKLCLLMEVKAKSKKLIYPLPKDAPLPPVTPVI